MPHGRFEACHGLLPPPLGQRQQTAQLSLIEAGTGIGELRQQRLVVGQQPAGKDQVAIGTGLRSAVAQIGGCLLYTSRCV